MQLTLVTLSNVTCEKIDVRTYIHVHVCTRTTASGAFGVPTLDKRGQNRSNQCGVVHYHTVISGQAVAKETRHVVVEVGVDLHLTCIM